MDPETLRREPNVGGHADLRDAARVGHGDLDGIDEILALIARLDRRRRELRFGRDPRDRARYDAPRRPAGIDRHLRRRSDFHSGKLCLGDVGAENHGVEVRDLEQWLARLYQLSALGIGGEHGPADGCRDVAFFHALANLCELRVGRRNVLSDGALLGGCSLNLLVENLVLLLRLIELLCRGRLIGKETPHAFVVPLCDLVLHSKRIELLSDFRHARTRCRSLRQQLSLLE